jgi:hypothetical protein
MNDRNVTDAQISKALRAHLPAQAQAGLPRQVMEAVEITSQRRPLPSFLGALSDADPIGARRSLLIAAALLLALALASVAAVGAWRLLQREISPKLDLTPPADLPAFVLSSYDRMPQMPPVAITTLEGGSIKGRMYVDRSGAVRIEHYATPGALEPDTYKILSGTTMGELAIVGSTKEWVQQDGAISGDPRVFLLAEMEGGGAYNQPGCEVTRPQGDLGNGTAASGWRYIATDYLIGRPTFHVTCGGGDLWIDVQTRLVMRSRGPARNASFEPVPGSSRTIEVTALVFGEQPADLFAIAPPAGVADMSIDEYQCKLEPTACATPSPTQPPYTPLPGVIKGPLPPLPPSRVSNGWIAYSTDGQNPGSTDITTGSDIYLVREGGEPRLIAGRQGGTTRNVCPAFSPDGSRLAYGVASTQGRAVLVIGVDANGVADDPVRIAVPGSGPGVCVRWSSDGRRLAYLDGGPVVVRGLDSSSPAIAAGDPGVKDLERGRDPSDPLISPSGDWVVRLSDDGNHCQIVVARPDGTAAHVITLTFCPYAIAAWSPDGRQVLVLEDVGEATTLRAIGVDSTLTVPLVFAVGTNGARSSPGRGDVSWQPVFP